jgi:DNA-binding protein H-NS
MGSPNGKFTEKSVTEWFSALEFDQQRSFLSTLAEAHDKIRELKRSSLMHQLSQLDGEGARKPGRPAGKARLVKKRKGAKAAVKYRDPKTGDTWSGRGRMASWLAAKVEAGQKAEKYLV